MIAGGAVAFVAWPFLRASPRPQPQPQPDDRLRLLEHRDRALAALKELEFDHRTGKVSDDDYRRLVGPLRARAAETLRALEPHGRLARGAGGKAERMVEIPEPPRPPGEPVPPEPSPEPVPEPYPPPDEVTPPEPARIPEPGPLDRRL